MKLCADPQGMPSSTELAAALKPALNRIFKPAFLGRLVIVPYYPVRDETLKRIIVLKIDQQRQEALAAPAKATVSGIATATKRGHYQSMKSLGEPIVVRVLNRTMRIFVESSRSHGRATTQIQLGGSISDGGSLSPRTASDHDGRRYRLRLRRPQYPFRERRVAIAFCGHASR